MAPSSSSMAVRESQAKRQRLNAEQVTAKLAEAPIRLAPPPPPAPVPPPSPLPASKPDVPTCPDAVGVRVLPLMQELIPFVKYELRLRIRDDTTTMYAAFSDVDLHSHQPLEIRAAAGEADMLSYKAPWKRESAKLALGGAGLYEASGSLFWLNPFPPDAEMSKCAGATPSWKSVHAAADAFRPDDLKAFEMGSEGPTRQKRILFPAVMAVHAPTLDGFLAEAFPGNVQEVTGHVLIYAWYLAMFQALQGGHAL